MISKVSGLGKNSVYSRSASMVTDRSFGELLELHIMYWCTGEIFNVAGGVAPRVRVVLI